MYYPKCKIYNDGGHFIAIPPTTRPFLQKRPKSPEKLIAVVDKKDESEAISDKENCEAKDEKSANKPINNIKGVRLLTKKELFNELYEESSKMKKRERKVFIVSKMTPYFNSEKEARQFVEDNFARQLRNLICRKTRLYRKARLQPWSYFCTFTYDSAKHSEESFRKKLSDTFKKMCHRRGWKYIGVWERSVEKERLHFHGLFYIPDGEMISCSGLFFSFMLKYLPFSSNFIELLVSNFLNSDLRDNAFIFIPILCSICSCKDCKS